VLRSIPIAVMVTLAAAAPTVSAETAFRPVTIYDGLLAMKIPGDWQEIDPLQLEELSMWAADTTGGRLVEIYQYGFCPREFEDAPLLPYILVQVRESGRLRYGAFVDLPPLSELQSDTRSTFPQGVPPLVVGVAVDRVAFDRSNYSIRLEHSLDLRIRGRITVLTAAFLTERGLVTLYYADRERRIDRGRELFDRIVASVVLAPEIAYRPRLGDRWPGLPFFVAAAGLTAVLIALLVRRRRLRS
jgi:hypothetical protein